MTLLASLEDFAASRGVSFDPTDEAALIALEAASSTVRRKTQQTFDYVVADEVFLNGERSKKLLLPQIPVHGVTEVATIDEDAVETVILDTDGEWTLGDHGVLHRRWGWTAGVRNVRVIYDHGYILPGQTAVDDVPFLPSELSMLTMQIALRSSVLTASGGTSGAVTARQIDEYREEFGSGGAAETIELTPIETDILNGYRQVSVA